MKNRMSTLIDGWVPQSAADSVFRTTEDQHIRNAYFIDSAEDIRFFLEEDAVDTATGKVKTGIPKGEMINKAGHALHVLDPIFREYAFSPKVVSLVKSLGYTDPVLPQSMYIFKQPRIGGVVTSHQDSSFLLTEPRMTCLGLWLALDDADESNGCLWFRPGSHGEPLRRIFSRISEDSSSAAFLWVNKDDESNNKWEGKLPGQTSEELRVAGFVPVPVKAGDLVGIHGQVDHLSLANNSGRPRHSFQLHLVEGPKAGVTWSHRNWLQYPDGRPFPPLSLVRNVHSD